MDQTALAKQVHAIMRERMRAYGLIPAIREIFWEVKGLDLHKEARKCGVMDVYDLLDQEPDLFRREGDGWRALPNKDSTDKKALVKFEKKEDLDNGNQPLNVPKIGQNISLPNGLYEALQHWLEKKGLLLSDMEQAIEGWKNFKPENDREMSMVHQGLSTNANTIQDLEFELFVAKKSLETSFERLRLSVKNTKTDAKTVEETVRLRIEKLYELKKRELETMKKWTMLDLKNEIVVSMLAEVFLKGTEEHMWAFEDYFIVGNEMCFLTEEGTSFGVQVSRDDSTNKNGVPSVAIELMKFTPKSVGSVNSQMSFNMEPNEEGQASSSTIVEPGASAVDDTPNAEPKKSKKKSKKKKSKKEKKEEAGNGSVDVPQEEKASLVQTSEKEASEVIVVEPISEVPRQENGRAKADEHTTGNANPVKTKKKKQKPARENESEIVRKDDVPKTRRGSKMNDPYGDLTQAHNNRTGQMKASHSQGSSTGAHHPTGSEVRMKFSNVPVVGQKVDQMPDVLYDAIQSRLEIKKVNISDLVTIMQGWEDFDPSETEFPLIHQVLSEDESTLAAFEYDVFYLKSSIKRSFERLKLSIDGRKVQIPDVKAMVVARIEELRDVIRLEKNTLEKWRMIDCEDKEVVKLLTDLFMNKTEEDILEFEENYLAGCVKEVQKDEDSLVNRPHLSVVPNSSENVQLRKELNDRIQVWMTAKELTISRLTNSIKGWERFEPKYHLDIAIVNEILSSDNYTLSDFEQHVFTDEKTIAEVFKQDNPQFEYKEVNKTDVAEKVISRVKELIERRSYIQETLEKWKVLDQIVMNDEVLDLLINTFFKGTKEHVIDFETNYLDDFLMEMYNGREVHENEPQHKTEARIFENGQDNTIDANGALAVAPAVDAVPNSEPKKTEKKGSMKKDDTGDKKKEITVKKENKGENKEKKGKGRNIDSASQASAPAVDAVPNAEPKKIEKQGSGKKDDTTEKKRDNPEKEKKKEGKDEKRAERKDAGSASQASFKTSPFISLEGIMLEITGKQDRDWNELRDNSANKYENSVEEFAKSYDVFEKTSRKFSLKAGQRTALEFLDRRIEGFENTEANLADFHIGFNRHNKELGTLWGLKIEVDEVDKCKKLIREDIHQRLNVYRSLKDIIGKLPPKTIMKICYLDSLFNLDNFLIMEHGFIKQYIITKIKRKLEAENN